jgi:hypothetical protein
VDWEALGWSLAAGLWLTLLLALPPLLAFIIFGWPAAVVVALAVGALITLLVKRKWKWSEFGGYAGLALLFGGFSITIYQLLLDRVPPLAAAFASLSLQLLYHSVVAYWYAVGALPPMYWGEEE